MARASAGAGPPFRIRDSTALSKDVSSGSQTDVTGIQTQRGAQVANRVDFALAEFSVGPADHQAHLNNQPRGLVVADLPFENYETPQQAVESAKRLVAAGAEAVKAEGGQAILPQLEAIHAVGIPFLGHLGMLPQHVLEEGGYRIKGRDEAQREALLADARALGQAGAFGIVLELVTPTVAAEITRLVDIPTIGIGSGENCDGQILVTTDLLGTSPDFIPKHAQPDELLRDRMIGIIRAWKEKLPRPSATHE
mgnify:CR=1 FL=1